MLILGIETATERVSVAIGGHEGVIGLFEITKGRRHAETLVPAIEFTCRQAGIEMDEISVVAVDVGPGLFTGMRVGLASAKAIAQALRIPMIGISSLDLLAFPCRHSDRVVVPVIDARKGEVFYAMYKQVPGGIQQVAPPQVGPIDELVADLMARNEETLCVGDGARRYSEEILEGFHCEIGGDAYPSASPLVQLAHARALREEWVNPREIEPVYLREPDALINWKTRIGAMSVIERMLGRESGDAPGPGGVVLSPMRKRDLKDGVLETERHAYPTPWSPGVFQSEIEQMRSGSRYYLTARRPAAGKSRGRIVGHAGLWFAVDEAHVTNVAVHPDARRSGVATALMLALATEAVRRECAAWTLEVRVSSSGAQELYRKFGFAPAGVRKRYYDNVEDAIVMWCHDIQGDEYAARLAEIRGDR